MIIDTHVHLSLYQENAQSLEEALELLIFEMKKNGIGYAIIIPDNIENDPQIADLAKAQQLIHKYSNLFLLGSPQIIERGSSELEKYRNLFEEGKIKGIKFFPGHDPYYPVDRRCLPYYQICEALDVPVVVHTGINSGHPEVGKYNDPKYVVEVAKRFPKLKVIITHYFWPKMDYCYEVTKDTPNIYFEIAAMADGEVVEAAGGIDKIKDILIKTINDRPDQVIFGTDWPMCKIEEHIKLVRQLNLSKVFEDKVMFKNAVNVYKLPINN